MSILVTGAFGQLGQSVIKKLKQNNMPCIALSKQQLDITDYNALFDCFVENKPQVVIHCAAYTDVDKAEKERQKCFSVNMTGTQNIAKLCSRNDVKIVYISTDYVFDGTSNRPYEVTDEPKPVNYYAKTKFEGELAIRHNTEKYFILRSGLMFGGNNNFVKSIIQKSKSNLAYYAVTDQIISPTYSDDLADLIIEMIGTQKYGTYHASNEGSCSLFDFAKEIAELTGSKNYPKGISYNNYKTGALVPLYSVLSKASLDIGGFKRLPDYHDALRRYIKTIEEPKPEKPQEMLWRQYIKAD